MYGYNEKSMPYNVLHTHTHTHIYISNDGIWYYGPTMFLKKKISFNFFFVYLNRFNVLI